MFPAAPSRLSHRPDIQWLRALAVLIVILYHLNVTGFEGGYVGVDVFFVVSGYLITRLLLHEAHRTGRIDLRAFVLRRIRRLLPVSTLVFVATLGLLFVYVHPLRRATEAGIATATALFGANIGLAAAATDYSSPGGESVFQHYWSLAVEEQFYLVWPTLLLLTILLAVRLGWTQRTALWGMIAGLGVLSLATAMVWTVPDQPLAFFLLPARAWELLVGAALALGELTGRVRPRGRATTRLLGLVLIALATVDLLGGTTFPWPLALLSVTGAAMLVAAGIGEGEDACPSWLRNPAMLWIGDRSYAMYLWHWPPIVVLNLTFFPWTDRPLLRLGVVVGTVVASGLTYRMLEEPLRHGTLLRRPSAALAVLIGSVGISLGAAAVATATPTTLLDGPTVAAPGPGWWSDRTLPEPDVLPGNLRPSPVDALLGEDTLREECQLDYGDVDVAEAAACTYGNPSASSTIVLVGDSHAAHWFPGLEQLAAERDVRLVVYTKVACAPLDLHEPEQPDAYPQCTDYQASLLERLVEIGPDVVLLGAFLESPDAADTPDEVKAERLGRAIRTAATAAGGVVVLGDPPPASGELPLCVVEQPLNACATNFDRTLQDLLLAVSQAEGAAFVDTAAALCRDDRCPAVIANVLVLRDDDHLTTEMSRELAGLVAEKLDQFGVGS